MVFLKVVHSGSGVKSLELGSLVNVQESKPPAFSFPAILKKEKLQERTNPLSLSKWFFKSDVNHHSHQILGYGQPQFQVPPESMHLEPPSLSSRGKGTAFLGSRVGRC